jgi:coenzyme Q-binding protein COQ10
VYCDWSDASIMKTRTACAHLHYTPAQVFDLVADVEQYPKFLPWFISAKVLRRKEQTMWVELTMGVRLFHKRFTTVAQLARPSRIYINSRDPLFEHFEQNWTFEPAAGGGTDVEYRVDFQFRSLLLQILIESSLTERTVEMVAAYKRRAQELYGASPITP